MKTLLTILIIVAAVGCKKKESTPDNMEKDLSFYTKTEETGQSCIDYYPNFSYEHEFELPPKIQDIAMVYNGYDTIYSYGNDIITPKGDFILKIIIPKTDQEIDSGKIWIIPDKKHEYYCADVIIKNAFWEGGLNTIHPSSKTVIEWLRIEDFIRARVIWLIDFETPTIEGYQKWKNNKR